MIFGGTQAGTIEREPCSLIVGLLSDRFGVFHDGPVVLLRPFRALSFVERGCCGAPRERERRPQTGSDGSPAEGFSATVHHCS
jgi:hypothetical protein